MLLRKASIVDKSAHLKPFTCKIRLALEALFT